MCYLQLVWHTFQCVNNITLRFIIIPLWWLAVICPVQFRLTPHHNDSADVLIHFHKVIKAKNLKSTQHVYMHDKILKGIQVCNNWVPIQNIYKPFHYLTLVSARQECICSISDCWEMHIASLKLGRLHHKNIHHAQPQIINPRISFTYCQ